MNLMSFEFLERVEDRNGSWIFCKNSHKTKESMGGVEWQVMMNSMEILREQMLLGGISEPYDKALDTLTTGASTRAITNSDETYISELFNHDGKALINEYTWQEVQTSQWYANFVFRFEGLSLNRKKERTWA
ncbi:unnamed protein product [Lepeophtheirus salmonis]|uniref:(salmon louse) hypothetical protein n=1 Tax=Lepeophtheirus salmonis TaxID=72036 RepID=A0A817FAX0_LEPSM|nr:unnamed protein product [Lepeophtheirus salmonis]CAG9476442.1 unnamed protein product [Lepeophtheirus salmonis]